LRIDNAIVPTTSTHTFTDITQNHSINITFKEIPANQFYLTLQAQPSNLGTVSGGGAYDSGSVRNISAVANTGSHFVR
jgi:hypothetical protein